MNTAIMRANLDVALKTMGLSSDYQVVDLATLNADDPRTGYPTPTVLYRNADVFGSPAPTPPFPEPTWRFFPDGVPSAEAIQAALTQR